MAQRFKAKTLLSNSGVFNNEVIAPNLVYNTGNETISGVKIFANPVIFDTISGNLDLNINTPHDLTLRNGIGALLYLGGEEKAVTLSGDEANFYFTYLDIYSPVTIRGILNGYTGTFEKLFANN
jgi:hypothetical protein